MTKKRLEKLYTVDGEGKEFKKPEKYCKYISIDEFLLHKGHKYATVIIDLETGHILYLRKGKKKQVVYDFINFVGEEWMSHVEAVACDMNSDFEEAFLEKCPHIDIVFDHFHIVKNFNDKVINAVRKDEIKRLEKEGNEEGAKSLKGSKYILQSNRATLQAKDKEAEEGKIISKSSELLQSDPVVRKGGNEERLDAILKENKLLSTAYLIKEKLDHAYKAGSERTMKIRINQIIDLCRETKNRHFIWFAKLLENHLYGIISYAKHHISSGKTEGTNNMIKATRRAAFGYGDDEYFFLKIMDKSHRFD